MCPYPPKKYVQGISLACYILACSLTSVCTSLLDGTGLQSSLPVYRDQQARTWTGWSPPGKVTSKDEGWGWAWLGR